MDTRASLNDAGDVEVPDLAEDAAYIIPNVTEYERKLAARDKTIDVLKRRLMQEAGAEDATPFAVLAENYSLNQIVVRKTAELEAERHELEKTLHDLRQTQAQLLQAQKLESIGQLAAGIAHEINTPTQYVADNLGFIKTAANGLLDLLDAALTAATAARGAGVDEALFAELDAALKRTKVDYLRRQIPCALDESIEGLQHIVGIVSAMKEFSHPSRGEKEAVDIREVIRTTITVARNEWKYVAEVDTRFADDLPPVPCLRDMIGQAILNLVVNAAHAIEGTLQQGAREKGHIMISAGCVGGHVEIRVSDDGGGIPVGIRDRIFDPFFTTKPVGKGTGQGLSMAYATVVDKHNGRLFFETDPGHGTSFCIHLPLQAALADEEGEA
jgi:signal transduction histidine kinase